MIYNEGIKKGLSDGLNKNAIARKIYLSYPTFVFKDLHEKEFKLVDDICYKFQIPLKAVQFAGSSKTGFSYSKQRAFIKGSSDLDIAIIDQGLFLYYTESVFELTKSFSDLSKFGRTEDGISHFDLYKTSILKGFFRPDVMPYSNIRREWFNYFNKLSQDYIDLFSNINAGIYLSEYYFTVKQSQNINLYKKL
jgi:hypothetical protein